MRSIARCNRLISIEPAGVAQIADIGSIRPSLKHLAMPAEGSLSAPLRKRGEIQEFIAFAPGTRKNGGATLPAALAAIKAAARFYPSLNDSAWPLFELEELPITFGRSPLAVSIAVSSMLMIAPGLSRKPGLFWKA